MFIFPVRYEILVQVERCEVRRPSTLLTAGAQSKDNSHHEIQLDLVSNVHKYFGLNFIPLPHPLSLSQGIFIILIHFDPFLPLLDHFQTFWAIYSQFGPFTVILCHFGGMVGSLSFSTILYIKHVLGQNNMGFGKKQTLPFFLPFPKACILPVVTVYNCELMWKPLC